MQKTFYLFLVSGFIFLSACQSSNVSKTGYLDIDGAQIYYEKMGKGFPIVLLHGGFLDRRMWDPQFEVFARHYRVIRYDIRNHGLTKTPPGEYYNYEDLNNLFGKLGLKKAVIMGLSLGGRIAVNFALHYPDKVAALIAVAPGVTGYKFKNEKLAANTEKLREAFGNGDMAGAVEYFQRSWTDGPHREPSDVEPQIREKVRLMALNSIEKWNREAVVREPEPPAIQRLGELRCPTLAVVGDLDMPGILEIVDIIVNNNPEAKKVFIPGVAHMVNMEKPDDFNRIVIDYLKSII